MKSGISIAVFLVHISNSSVTPVSSFLDACCTLLHLLVFVFQKNSQTLIKWPAKSKLITIYLPWSVVQLDWFNKSSCINKLNNPNLNCVSKSVLRGDFAVPDRRYLLWHLYSCAHKHSEWRFRAYVSYSYVNKLSNKNARWETKW